MNYNQQYESLILKSINKVREKGLERHHIVPDCLFLNRKRPGPPGLLEGDPDEPSNFVYLTKDDHIEAHYLLTKIYPDHSGIHYAYHTMMERHNKTMSQYDTAMLIKEFFNIKHPEFIKQEYWKKEITLRKTTFYNQIKEYYESKRITERLDWKIFYKLLPTLHHDIPGIQIKKEPKNYLIVINPKK